MAGDGREPNPPRHPGGHDRTIHRLTLLKGFRLNRSNELKTEPPKFS